jgi:pimeloyl-ACP methyl ester carboxylesterase
MAHHGVQRVHIVGWCTGAQVAARFAAVHPRQVASLFLLNGSFVLPGEEIPKTLFRKNLTQLMFRVAESRAKAETYHRLLYGDRNGQASGGGVSSAAASISASPNEDRTKMAQMLGATDPMLLHLTSAPFRTPESLYRYAHLQAQFAASDSTLWAPSIQSPTFLLTANNDEVAHPDESRVMAGLIAQSELMVRPDASHFSILTDAKTCDIVRRFIDIHAANAAEEAAAPFERDVSAVAS